MAVEWYKKCITTASSTVLLGPIHNNTYGTSLAPYLCDGDFSASLSLLIFNNHSWQNVHSYDSATCLQCNSDQCIFFKALQKHQLTTHDNYNYNFVIFAYTRPPYWTGLNLLMSSVHFGRKPNRERVCGSLNRTSPNHYGSEPDWTGIFQNHAFTLQNKFYLTSDRSEVAELNYTVNIAGMPSTGIYLEEIKAHLFRAFRKATPTWIMMFPVRFLMPPWYSRCEQNGYN